MDFSWISNETDIESEDEVRNEEKREKKFSKMVKFKSIHQLVNPIIMFNEFSEEDLVLTLDLGKGLTNGKKHKTDDIIQLKVCELYKTKMFQFMKSVPHITPTPFELNSRHMKVKQSLIGQLKAITKEHLDLDLIIHTNGNGIINGNGIHNGINGNGIHNGINGNGIHNGINGTNNSSNELVVNRLIERIDNEMENIFKELTKDNRIEYKKCQLGFTIGWKCNVNQPNYSYEKFDDRF
ncbi:unnamed protein product [Oppiella nova]|uniref:Uncharacterized protein n=1 Tax=Oppiella nova TaxID=334625 RepID=A0A7R9M2X3_9ACAR|nr:unnamed protein product [Oppiella nova]CAG2169577.1 unnamed protein product [Oppiella nova]